MKYCLLSAIFLIFPLDQVSAETEDLLHTFYGFEIVTTGRNVATLKTSADVVLGTTINIDFEGRCKVSLLFENGSTSGYRLVLTIKEIVSLGENIYAVPVDHTYAIQLDEELRFSIQSNNGLTVSGNLKLTKVSRIEIAA